MWAKMVGEADRLFSMPTLSAYAGESVTLPISMVEANKYSSMQMQINLPEGVSVSDVTVGEGAEEHQLFVGYPEDGIVRIALGSLDNTKMTDQPVAYVTLNIANGVADGQYSLELCDLLAVTPDLNSTRIAQQSSSIYVGDATGINNAEIANELQISVKDRAVYITSERAQKVSVYSASGALVYSEQFADGETKVKQLPAGVYVINDKKIAIR